MTRTFIETEIRQLTKLVEGHNESMNRLLNLRQNSLANYHKECIEKYTREIEEYKLQLNQNER